MKKSSYKNESQGPEVSGKLILSYLIKRCNELLGTDSPNFPVTLQALALAAFVGDEELSSTCKAVFSSPHLPPEEILRRSIEIFEQALDGPVDDSPSQEASDLTEDNHVPDEKYCRHIMMSARREGKLMKEQRDYRFITVFECLAWIALQADAECLELFEEARIRFKDDPEDLIGVGINIIHDALFRRRPSGRIVRSKN